MATNVTDWGGAYWLGVLFGQNSIPATYYLALAWDEPDEGYDGTVLASIEPTDTAYARVAITNNGTNWGATDGLFTSNLLQITFASPTQTWETVTHYALCDAATAGNVYCFGEFVEEIVADVGSPAVVPVAGILIALGSALDPVDD